MVIGIVGLGVIGGSITKTLKKYDLNIEIIAFDTNVEQLRFAKEDKNIDEYTTQIDESFKKCDVIFICTPVSFFDEIFNKLILYISERCIVTDVSSTKSNIMKYVSKFENVNFIGGHPMAGSEKSGYINSNDILFENAFYIVTPSHNTKKEDVEKLKIIIGMLGAIFIEVEACAHDEYVSIISHMPHIIASTLVNYVKNNDNDEQMLKTLCAGGFKDITRIASSDGALWQSIITSNKVAVTQNIRKFIDELNKVCLWIEDNNKNELINYIDDGKVYRNSFKTVNNYMSNFNISVDVKDEPKVIGIVATILGDNEVNIKNIAINNNREDGVFALTISFYDINARDEAYRILNNSGYKTILL